MNIRQASASDAAGIARVQVDSWRTTYRDIVPAEYLDNMSYAEREQKWEQWLSDPESKTFAYIALNGASQVVGFVSGGANRAHDPLYAAELHAIYILQEYQGRGIGRRLTLTLATKLLELGLDSMLLWVLAGNPARRFYEALGGQLVKTSQFELTGATLDEVAYGWFDIRDLLGKYP
jgi:ribosomal protein S18 acetylase RimI-like enzyme